MQLYERPITLGMRLGAWAAVVHGANCCDRNYHTAFAAWLQALGRGGGSTPRRRDASDER
jgi:hypothetical protein